MLEFNCLMNPPKFLVKWKKHRFTFALNETDTSLVPLVSKFAIQDKWLLAHIKSEKGNMTNEDVIGQMVQYKIDVRDKTIYIVFDALNGDPHVEGLLNAHMKGEWLKVSIEETEAPYDMAKRTKRSTRTARKTTWTTQERPRTNVHASAEESDM